MSAHLADIGKKQYTVSIDLKPALDEAMLDKRLLSDFAKYGNRNFDNSLDDLLPKKMIDIFVKLSGIAPTKKVNEITKEERRRLVALFKDFRVTVKHTRPIDEAIVTAGGIGTLEEFFEIYTLRHLGRHEKKIAIFNDGGCFDPLVALLRHTVKEGFLPEEDLSLLFVSDDAEEILAYFEK